MAYFTWAPIKRGDNIPEGAILGGRTSTDGEVFVGRNRAGEVGKLNLQNGKMWNLWCHTAKDSPDGEILIVHPGCPIQWIPVSKGDPLPMDSVLAGNTKDDGPLYPCRRDGGGAVGKLNLNNGKCHNMWFHGDWFAKSDGEVLVVGPPGAGAEWAEQFAHASGGEAHGIGAWIKDHKGALAIAAGAAAAVVAAAAASGALSSGDKPSGYKPADQPAVAPDTEHGKHYEDPDNYDENAICDGIRAGERVAWLQKENSMDHAAAVRTVMKEFPFVFRDWWKPHADCGGIPAKERAKWLVDNKGLSRADARKQVRAEFPGAFDGSAPSKAPKAEQVERGIRWVGSTQLRNETRHLLRATITGSLQLMDTELILEKSHLTGSIAVDGTSHLVLNGGSITGPVNVGPDASFTNNGRVVGPVSHQ